MTDDSTYTDVLSNACVLKTGGAKLIGMTNKPHAIYDYCIPVPYVQEPLLPSVEVIPLQNLGYHLILHNNAYSDYGATWPNVYCCKVRYLATWNVSLGKVGEKQELR